ncbi:MAG: SRPBCC family protein [Gammaproteobacteria bacterium]|nr:MAG: SRPBCC family protein [Gammaproteobacteria bacterium]
MAIRIEHPLDQEADSVWAVVGDPARIDWVPGVERCDLQDDVRRFKMTGAGELAERIVSRDAERRRLEYSVIESTPPLQAHRAAIEVVPRDEGCVLIWETEVRPEAVEPFIRRSMEGALAQLEAVLGSR